MTTGSTSDDAELSARAGGELVGDREDVMPRCGHHGSPLEVGIGGEMWCRDCFPENFPRSERPPMEIGNVWVHDHQPTFVHYMIHWTDGYGRPQSQHVVELRGSALAKILETRIR